MTDAQTGGKEQREATAAEEVLKPEGNDDLEETPSTNRDFEEGRDAYRPGRFHPVYMGDVYNDRYQILRKIGYGQYSTVWLVKDLTQQYV
jgi:serine/threonine protein kinase